MPFISGGGTGGSGAGVSSFAKQGDTPLTGAVTISGGSGVTLTEAGQNVSIAASGSAPLTVDSVKTADFTAAAGTFYPVDLTSGNVTATLVAAPADATQVAVQRNIGASNTLTVAAGAGDTIGAGSPTSLPVVGDTVVYIYKASTKIWYGAIFLPNVTAADTSVVVGGTAQAPTIRTGTLDVIATQHAPAADWSNNSHKITGLTEGAAAGEAATYAATPAGIITASGDIIYGSGAHTAARLAKGSDGQVLTLASGLPSWATAAAGGNIPVAGALVNGALAATVPRFIALGQTPGGTSGTLYMWAITLEIGIPITSITFLSAGAGSVLTHQLFGIFDDSLGSSSSTAYALLAQTTDDTSTAWGANTAKTLNLTPGTYTPGRTGPFYLGVLVVGTTANTIRGLLADGIYGAIASNTGGASNTGLSALPNPANAPTFGGGTIGAAWVK